MKNCGKVNKDGVGDGFQRNLEYMKVKKMKRRKVRLNKRSIMVNNLPQVARRRLRNEKFFPSFTARNTFCKSRFRPEYSTRINGIPYSVRYQIVNNYQIYFPLFLIQIFSEKSVLSKIIDGRETEISEYPWMVSLQLSGNHFCGGALISNSYVITAAHCMEFGNVSDFLSRLTVSLGDHDITDTSETRNFVRHVDQVSYESQTV